MKKISVKEIEQIIDNLQSKHDSWLGHDGQIGRDNFKSGLSWAIESFQTLTSC